MSSTNSTIHQIVGALMVNLSTIQAHAATLNNYTDSTNALQGNWSGRDLDPNDPVEKQMQEALDAIDKQPVKSDDDKKKKREMIDDFISKYVVPKTGGDNTTVSHLSSKIIMHLQGQLSTCYDKDKSPIALAQLSAGSTLIQAESSKELAGPQALIKSEGSIIQQDAGAQQPLADAGNSFVTLLGSSASFLQQSMF
jgi:hypothetical protein